MAESDGDDYVFFGRPIEREEDTSSRKRKAVADAGSLRALPTWKQEVRDEEGRKRFHGAFTGGFSAGFYNTVGSKEGWTPQTFTSSRKNRAEPKKQSIYNFLDEDELKDLGGNKVETSMQYDTFGFTAAEFARKEANKEQEKRPSAIPGPAPDEIVLPASSSIGMKLLMKMGWRQGRSIKDSNADSLSEKRREARKALMAFSSTGEKTGEDQMEMNETGDEIPDLSMDDLRNSGNTPVFVLNPKQDLHGLGFDPYKHAPEFRDSKRLRESKSREKDKSKVHARGNFLSSSSGKYAPGFGIGALEEHDLEDEDIYASGFDYERTEVDLEPTRPINTITNNDYNKLRLENKKTDSLPGFKPASNSDYILERFPPPKIPRDFTPTHKFPSNTHQRLQNYQNAPPEIPPPQNTDLKKLIDGSADLIARSGKSIEDLYREKCKTNPMFSFIKDGAEGHEYYLRKLWENKQKFGDNNEKNDDKLGSEKKEREKLSAENRGRILGEKPLVSTYYNNNNNNFESARTENDAARKVVGDSLTKPINLSEVPESARRPFRSDPSKQERFEQFLKEKYQGGLRSSRSFSTGTGLIGTASILSEADRARERLDFESATESIEKGKWRTDLDAVVKGKSGAEIEAGESERGFKDLLGFDEDRFVSSSSTQIEKEEKKEEKEKEIYPKRELFEWRPAPILCKRFDLTDPYMGKPLAMPKPRSKIDNLIFLTETFKRENKEENETEIKDSVGSSKERETQVAGIDADVALSPKSVERPLDLYKAIFSDDSDDDMADVGSVKDQNPDPINTSEGANKTLNRLVASDFLESLGKQLGLEVPKENRPGPAFNANTTEEKGNSLMVKDRDDDVKSSEDRDDASLTKVKDSKSSKDDNEYRDSSRERKRSHSRRDKRRSSDSDSDSDSDYSEKREKSRRSRSSKRHRRRNRSRSVDSDSSERKYSDKKEKRRRHRHRRDSRDKYSEKKRRS
ncbi:hypothetical protein LUZ60_012820 [Juncus effusus]|nr:hypothetical protein LUZ60_012820 [Juncus effusus]